jgi:WD40 repeat protein
MMSEKALGPRFAWSIELPDYVNDLKFSPDGKRLAAASLAGSVHILDAETGKPQATRVGHEGGALALAWSPDSCVLASGGHDGRVQIRNAVDETVARHAGDSAWTEHLAWSADGKVLAVAAGRAVRFHSPTGDLLGETKDHESTVTAMVWLPGNEQLAAACYGGVSFLRVGSPAAVRQFRWKGSILALAASDNGQWLVSGNQDASVHVWKMKSGEDLQMGGFPTKVRALAFRSDSLKLATAGGQFIVLWDFAGRGPGGRRGTVLEGHAGLVSDLVFLRRRKNASIDLLSVGHDGRFFGWSSETSLQPVHSTVTNSPLVKLAVDAEGRRVAIGSRSGCVTAFTF